MKPVRAIAGLALGCLPACSFDGFFFMPVRAAGAGLAPRPAGVAEVRFSALGGPSLHGWWMPAPRPARGTVVFCHGNYGDLSHHFGLVRWLPSRGYNLLIFDYRGYGTSGGKVSRAGAVADAVAALDFALRRDPERTVVFGHSLGGAIAAAAVARRPRVRAVILASTFATYWQMAAAKAPYVAWLAWMVASRKFDPVDALPAIPPRPLLVLHGTADAVVPFELGHELFERAAEPKQFVEVPGGGHDLPPGGDPEHFATMLCDFIAAAVDEPGSAVERRAERQQH